MSKRNPTLPDNARLDQFDDFPLGHNSVGEVQPPIFPLHRAVQIQSITQPVIWWTPDRITKRSTTKTVMSFCKNPAKAKMNLMKMGGKKSCIPGLKLFGTQWVWNIFNGVTQTVSVVIGRIDAPAKKDKASSLGIHCCEKRCCGFFFIYTIHLLSDDAVCILFGMPQDPSFHPPWPSSSWGWPLPQQTGPSSSSQTAPATLRWVDLSTVIEEHYGLSAPRLSDGTHTRDPWRRRKEMSQTPSVHQHLHISCTHLRIRSTARS